MVDVNAKIINKINDLWNKTDLPRFVLTKRKSWAYEKDGAKIYMFSNPDVEGVMLLAIFKNNGVSLEYSAVENGEYSKIVYYFYRGEITNKKYFDTSNNIKKT